MERRAFLAAGVASGLALAIAPEAAHPTSLAPAPPAPRPGPVDDLDLYLARLDSGMERLGRWSVTADAGADRAAADTLARGTMQTLFLTGMVADLPPHQQTHPGIQLRLRAGVPLMDETVDGLRGFLLGRTDAQLACLQAELRGPHRLAAQVAGRVDAEAAACGCSAYRREQLRSALSLAAWRLANEPPAPLIRGYAEAIDRIEGSEGAMAARRLWRAFPDAGRVVPFPVIGAGASVAVAGLEAPKRSLRERRIGTGLFVMGLGVVIFAGGYFIGSSSGFDTDYSGGRIGVAMAGVGLVLSATGLLALIGGLMTPLDAVEPPSAR